VLVAALGNLGSLMGTFLYILLIFPLLKLNPIEVISLGIHNMGIWAGGLF
jgi:hypothetical protein